MLRQSCCWLTHWTLQAFSSIDEFRIGDLFNFQELAKVSFVCPILFLISLYIQIISYMYSCTFFEILHIRLNADVGPYETVLLFSIHIVTSKICSNDKWLCAWCRALRSVHMDVNLKRLVELMMTEIFMQFFRKVSVFPRCCDRYGSYSKEGNGGTRNRYYQSGRGCF